MSILKYSLKLPSFYFQILINFLANQFYSLNNDIQNYLNLRNGINIKNLLHGVQKYINLAKILIKTQSLFRKMENEQKMRFVPISEHQQYQNMIMPLLKQLAYKQLKTNEVISTLQKFKLYSTMTKQLNYNHRQKKPFQKLFKLYEDQIPQIFSSMAKVVLQQKEQLKASILQTGQNRQIQFDKKQIIYLMSLMALNLVPFQKYNQNINKSRRFPFPNDFSLIFQQQQFKTRTIMQYFKEYFEDKDQSKNQFKFTIRRQVLSQKIEEIILKNGDLPMSQYQITSDDKSIEEYYGQAKVDFANRFIGGGALSHGCVQQQIMFANHPQLYTSVLFCQVMQDNQSLFLSGYKKYSKNSGYGFSTKYQNQQNMNYQKDQAARQKQYIIAIDALNYNRNSNINQAQKQVIDRQLKKAYSGFNMPENIDIVTGNWGCGAFNGQVRIKFLIQWIACSLAQKKMIYCPFGSRKKITQNQKTLQLLKQKNVGQVYNLFVKAGKKIESRKDCILEKISLLL